MYPIVVMWHPLIPIVPVMNAVEEQFLDQLNIDTGKLHKHNTSLHMIVLIMRKWMTWVAAIVGGQSSVAGDGNDKGGGNGGGDNGSNGAYAGDNSGDNTDAGTCGSGGDDGSNSGNSGHLIIRTVVAAEEMVVMEMMGARVKIIVVVEMIVVETVQKDRLKVI